MSKYGMSHFIGVTSDGVPFPVFYDPHYAISINRPPVTVITGEPGSGKTVFSLLATAHSAISNKITIVVDPKGDFINLKKLEMAGVLPKVNVWSAFSDVESREVDSRNFGMLDPTCMTEDIAQNTSLTIDVIKTLAQSITHKQSAALIPIVQDITGGEHPSFSKVVNTLKRNQDTEIRSLGFQLELMLDTQIAKLLVAPSKKRNRINLSEGTIVMSLLGVSFPNAKTPKESYSNDELIAVAIMSLLTYLILDVMKKIPKSRYKTLVIDEAWAVIATASGKSMINDVSLLGRSLNMATILTTQSPRHLESPSDEASIENTITTRFAFRNQSNIDNKTNAELMKLPGGLEGIYGSLRNGECFMQDARNQLGRVQIELSPQWLNAFTTTPQAKKKKSGK